ncbi:MAG: hypothetical protein EBS77_05915 [Gammaproteobacteria bacterium]|nr:hypothetical protein [Gammaproteobacteria bacterium]
MNDDAFNMSMRKFLKSVGVTSQQKIEEAVRAAEKAGQLPDQLTVTVELRMPELGLHHTVDGQITVESP